MKNLIRFIILIIFIAAVWSAKLVYIGNPGSTAELQEFTIETGKGVSTISQNLKEAELISNEFIFKAYLKLSDNAGNLQAGVYELAPNMSYKVIVERIASGEVISNERKITILEGWNLRDIASYFIQEGVIENEQELYAVTGAPTTLLPEKKFTSKDYAFLRNTDDVTLEGFLFPDTYRVFKDATIEEIVEKMLDNFDAKLTQNLRDEISKQGKSIVEIVTFASVLEKESPPAQMKKIAGVFANRLEAPMRLQSDPTVNYVTGKVTDRPSLDDTNVESPYNTYRNDGLPIGPISNPSITAIEAAIYPESHDYFFFINTPEGELIYSKNFEEHKANRDKYLD